MNEKIIAAALSSVVAIVPLFVLPISGISVEFGKILFASVFAIVLVFSYCFHSFRAGAMSIPKNPVLSFLFFIALWYFLSSVFSGSFRQSFFGNGEAGTAFSVLIFTLIAYLIAVFINTKERAVSAFLAFIASSALVFLFQLFHFAFPAGTSFGGTLAEQTQNLIGQWSDLGIFSGLALLLSAFAVETFSESKKIFRFFLCAVCAAAFFFHAAAPYSFSWVLLFGISGAFAAYGYMQKRNLSAVAAVAALSFAMIFAGPAAAEKIFEVFQLPPNTEIRPSFQVTSDIAAANMQTGMKAAIAGEGPNRFFIAWRKFHPADVNMTEMWNVDFYHGSSFIATSAVTVGAVGIILWMMFLGIFAASGYAITVQSAASMSPFLRFFFVSSFAGALFLWLAAACNSPGNTIIFLAFAFTGLFASASALSGFSLVRTHEYRSDFKKGRFVLLFILMLSGVVAALSYGVWNEARAVFLYRQALVSSAAGDMENAEVFVSRAIRYSKNDAYYRSLAALQGFRAQKILQSKELSEDEIRLKWSELYNLSVESAEAAVSADPYNYQNIMSLGNAHAALAPLRMEGISEGAFQESAENYLLAQKMNPKNPSIPLSLAELSAAAGKKKEAVEYAKEALSLKSDYAEALSLLAKLEKK